MKFEAIYFFCLFSVIGGSVEDYLSDIEESLIEAQQILDQEISDETEFQNQVTQGSYDLIKLFWSKFTPTFLVS